MASHSVFDFVGFIMVISGLADNDCIGDLVLVIDFYPV